MPRLARTLLLGSLLLPVTGWPQYIVKDPTQSLNMARQLDAMAHQLDQLKAQLQQAQAQYQALTGHTGLGALQAEGTAVLRNNLPLNWPQVYQDALNGYSGLTAQSEAMVARFRQQVRDMGSGEALDFVHQQLQVKGAYDRQMVQMAYDNQMRELTDIQRLTEQINQTTSPKQILDLQARIQTAQGAIQGEQVKLQLMAMAQQAQDKLLRLQQDEAVTRYTIGTDPSEFRTPNLTD